MKILKTTCVSLIILLLVLAACGTSQSSHDDATSGPTVETVQVIGIDRLIPPKEPTTYTAISASGNNSYNYTTMKLYEFDGNGYVEVDFITDDFDVVPERWLYVLQPGHEYVAVTDSEVYPPDQMAGGGCFLFSNNLSAGEIGSVSLLITHFNTPVTTEENTIFAQVKFVTDDDINLHHGKIDQLIGRAGYYEGHAYLQFTCQSGRSPNRFVEQATYYANSPEQSIGLEVYGNPNGICTPYDLDSDTYLWPSQHLLSEFIDITTQIENTYLDLYHTAQSASVSYSISQIGS